MTLPKLTKLPDSQLNRLVCDTLSISCGTGANYCSDLNRIHATVEQALANDDDGSFGYRYDGAMMEVTQARDKKLGFLNTMAIWHASARQRVLAFLLATGAGEGKS